MIALVNQKGGVGKTTCAAHLAAGLALQRSRVVAVDLDAQGNLARLLGCEPGLGSSRLLAGETLNGEVVEARPGLGLVTADKGLDVVVTRLLVEAGGRLPAGLLRERLEGLVRRAKVDYVVLDTAPTATQLQALAIAAADLVVIPAVCDYASRPAVVETVRTMRLMGRGEFMIVPTFYEEIPNVSREALAAYQRHTPGRTMAPIHRAAVIAAAVAEGKTVFETALSSRAAQEFSAFVWAVRGWAGRGG